MPGRHTVADRMKDFNKHINENYLSLACRYYEKAAGEAITFDEEDVVEVASFDAKETLDFMLQCTGLDEVAKRRSVQSIWIH